MSIKKITIMIVIINLLLIGKSIAQEDPIVEIVEINYYSDYFLNMKWGRENRNITAPHWVKSTTSEPIYCPIDEYIQMEVKFRLSPAWDSSTHPLYIRANGTSGVIVPEHYENVNFGAAFVVSETCIYQKAGHLTGNTIDVIDLTLSWQYSWDNGETWLDAGVSQNVCYLTLGWPQSPWGGSIPVYVEIMDLACMGMEGENDLNDAMKKLTTGMYGWLNYDGKQHYTYNYYNFYVQAFINDTPLDFSSGPPLGNDCRDFSCIHKTLTAAIGNNDVRITRFSHPGFFYTRPIKPSKDMAQTSALWNYHQTNYKIWGIFWYMIDASLLLDSDQNDANGWTSPGYLANWDIGWSSYCSRLSHDSLEEEWANRTCNLIEGPLP